MGVFVCMYTVKCSVNRSFALRVVKWFTCATKSADCADSWRKKNSAGIITEKMNSGVEFSIRNNLNIPVNYSFAKII